MEKETVNQIGKYISEYLYSHQIGKYVRAYYNESISSDDYGYQVDIMFYDNNDDDSDYFAEEFTTTKSPEEAEALADKINREGLERYMPFNKQINK
jgi:hypothetical protein